MKWLNNLFVWVSVALLRIWRLLLSPLFGENCRFYPSCSAYAEQAICRHGIFKGFLFTAKRICKCHPWNDGGFDPIPEKKLQ